MAYTPHVLIAFGGTTALTEQWSSSLRMVVTNPAGDPVAPTDADAANLLPKAITALSSWFATEGAGIDSKAKLLYVKSNAINGDGHYAFDETHADYKLNVSGGAVTGQNWKYPLQVSYALTLETDSPRSKGGRGRIYCPAPTFSLDNAGLVDATQVQRAADFGALLIRQMNTGGSVGAPGSFSVAVCSKLGNPGQNFHFVNAVSADRRLDIIRSRAAQQLTGDRLKKAVNQ